MGETCRSAAGRPQQRHTLTNGWLVSGCQQPLVICLQRSAGCCCVSPGSPVDVLLAALRAVNGCRPQNGERSLNLGGVTLMLPQPELDYLIAFAEASNFFVVEMSGAPTNTANTPGGGRCFSWLCCAEQPPCQHRPAWLRNSRSRHKLAGQHATNGCRTLCALHALMHACWPLGGVFASHLRRAEAPLMWCPAAVRCCVQASCPTPFRLKMRTIRRACCAQVLSQGPVSLQPT